MQQKKVHGLDSPRSVKEGTGLEQRLVQHTAPVRPVARRDVFVHVEVLQGGRLARHALGSASTPGPPRGSDAAGRRWDLVRRCTGANVQPGCCTEGNTQGRCTGANARRQCTGANAAQGRWRRYRAVGRRGWGSVWRKLRRAISGADLLYAGRGANPGN